MQTQRLQRVRRKVVWGGRLRRGMIALGFAGLTLALVFAAGCGDLTRQGRAASFLIIDGLLGRPGGDPSAAFTNVLQSDVSTNGTAFSDPGEVRMRLALKDPGPTESPATPSQNNQITVTRYRVDYKRADGRNTPGIHVPHPFDGAVTFTVVPGTVSADFTLVRAQAKLEPPLMALREVGGAMVISTIAEVTFYGHDQTGRAVSVTGSIEIHFADWADSD